MQLFKKSFSIRHICKYPTDSDNMIEKGYKRDLFLSCDLKNLSHTTHKRLFKRK